MNMLFIADFNTKTNDNDLFYRTSLEAIECRTSESYELEINQFDHNPLPLFRFDRLIAPPILITSIEMSSFGGYGRTRTSIRCIDEQGSDL